MLDSLSEHTLATETGRDQQIWSPTEEWLTSQPTADRDNPAVVTHTRNYRTLISQIQNTIPKLLITTRLVISHHRQIRNTGLTNDSQHHGPQLLSRGVRPESMCYWSKVTKATKQILALLELTDKRL